MPARIRQDYLKGSGHLGTKCVCCSEAINPIYQTCQSDSAWCASGHTSGGNTDPAFLVCTEWTQNETVLNGYAQSSACFPWHEGNGWGIHFHMLHPDSIVQLIMWCVPSQQLLIHMAALSSWGLSSQMRSWTEMPDYLSHSCLTSQGSFFQTDNYKLISQQFLSRFFVVVTS